jgi:thioredoxin-like negative regulator of GroEL
MEATAETYPDLIRDGTVLVDFWGPNCAPCLALMPDVEAAIEHRDGAVALVKVNAPEQRQICRDLRVFGLPTYLVYREGQEIERLTGDPSIDAIEEALDRALERG